MYGFITVPIEAYRSNAMFNATFYALFSKRRRGSSGRNAEKNAAECCRIFGFDKRAAISIRLDGTVIHYKL